LLLVDDVGKIDTFGERVEAVYVELKRDQMSQLGISEDIIINELRQKNAVANAGRVKVGPEFITITPTGGITAVEQFESILISGGGENQIYLRDVANVRRGYMEPQNHLIRYDGNPAIGLGISTIAGGNVVEMGAALKKRIAELRERIPVGIEAGQVSVQSDAVSVSINSFIISLLEAVGIVIVVLLFFMGLRSGILIGFVLLLTIAGTFIFMSPMLVALERISLGALIIALGMLVDNAIVVVGLHRCGQTNRDSLARCDRHCDSRVCGDWHLGRQYRRILSLAVSGRHDIAIAELGDCGFDHSPAVRNVPEKACRG